MSDLGASARGGPSPASFWQLFKPKILTVLGEGYGIAHFKSDALAGLTVAVVALPLAMALAIASGATPDKGLVTAVVAGFRSEEPTTALQSLMSISYAVYSLQ